MKRVYAKEEVCMGCGLCEVACATEHSSKKNTVKAYKEEFIVARNYLDKKENLSYSINCRHCEDPSCIEACITGAIDFDKNSDLVLIDKERCVAYQISSTLYSWVSVTG